MSAKIMNYNELNELINGDFYSYFPGYIDNLSYEYEDYKKELASEIEEIFNKNGLEINDVEIESGYYGDNIDDIKIFPYFDSDNTEFYRKNKIFAGDWETLPANLSGREREKKLPSGFFYIDVFLDDVYYSLKYEKLMFSKDRVNEIYDYIIESYQAALIQFLKEFDYEEENIHIKEAHIYLKELLTNIINEAGKYTFINYNKNNFLDTLNEIYNDFYNDSNLEDTSVLDILDVDMGVGLSDDEKEELEDKFNNFLLKLIDEFELIYENYESYIEYIQDIHHDIYEKIFQTFCKENNINFEKLNIMDYSDFIEADLKNEMFLVYFDENDKITHIEICHDEYECENLINNEDK